MLSQSKAIGGYFELELPDGKGHYYPDTLKYQSARSAFYALILHCKPNKIWMPYYICNSMLAPLIKAGVEVCFYSINLDFTIKDNVILNENELLLYVNYFGICGEVEDELLQIFDPQKLVFDHSQAFFAPPRDCLATIYSPRKFFGVPDGGLLVTKLTISEPETIDQGSIGRCIHLLKRLGGEPEDGYIDYHLAEDSLEDLEPKRMSILTERLLSSVDYVGIKNKREANFHALHKKFKYRNKINVKTNSILGPMIYPLLLDNGSFVKSNLIKSRCFVATYWSDCEKRVDIKSMESRLVSGLVPLPCDQRYSTKIFGDMKNEF